MLFQGKNHISSDLGLLLQVFEWRVLAKWLAHNVQKHETPGQGHSQLSLFPHNKFAVKQTSKLKFLKFPLWQVKT